MGMMSFGLLMMLIVFVVGVGAVALFVWAISISPRRPRAAAQAPGEFLASVTRARRDQRRRVRAKEARAQLI
jgi:hypothetical protein